jgi:hypothetical protein
MVDKKPTDSICYPINEFRGYAIKIAYPLNYRFLKMEVIV